MYTDKKINTGKPIIFDKKIISNNRIVPLNKVNNTLGVTSYFPPANQEWSNSIYAYNYINIKGISSAQKNISILISNYFDMYFSRKLLSNKKITMRSRRLSMNKILFSKPELKHTANKVIITLYVYNEEKRTLLNKLKRLETILFFSGNSNLFSSLKQKLSFLTEKASFLSWLKRVYSSVSQEISLNENFLEIKSLSDNKTPIKPKALEKYLLSIKNILSISSKDPISFMHYENIYNTYVNKILLEKEIASLAYYRLLLSINNHKLNYHLLAKLSVLINRVYNKQVEFNIVNLKAVYLNSDILAQAIALKLKNRKNRLLRVLRKFLYMVKLSKIDSFNKLLVFTDIKNSWVNKVRNLMIGSLPSLVNVDTINKHLTYLFSKNNFVNKNENSKVNKYIENKSNSNNILLFYILSLLKHKAISGVRLEAKGRLTRRFTASRSVFKIKWKGSLKNTDSSYRGLSSIILRGHIKSNAQYSLVHSKTRNGAFGIKGWISGK